MKWVRLTLCTRDSRSTLCTHGSCSFIKIRLLPRCVHVSQLFSHTDFEHLLHVWGPWDHGLNPCRSTLCELNHDHAWSGDEMRVPVCTCTRYPQWSNESQFVEPGPQPAVLGSQMWAASIGLRGVRLVCVSMRGTMVVDWDIYVLMFDYRWELPFYPFKSELKSRFITIVLMIVFKYEPPS